MKESYYFSHDYHARSDENIIKLLRVNGVEGYGIYWMVVEMLYEGGGSIPHDYELIAYEMRTQCERIKSVCEGFDLFYFKDGRIYSKSVDRRLAERENRSRKAYNSAMKRWDGNAKAMPTQCEGNAIKERKGKEIKGKERFTKPSIQEIIAYCKERGNGIDGQHFFNSNEAKGWVTGKLCSPIKDWKAVIHTWEKYAKDRKQASLTPDQMDIIARKEAEAKARQWKHNHQIPD
jgi:uncharacterized protein YdaU (DUF1376 family)